MRQTWILGAAFLAAAPLFAAEQEFTLDPAATKIEFVLEATGHDVHGSFALRSGTIRFDPATGAAMGEIVVDATGAQTGNEKRDKTMHNKVLESSANPEFVFRAERVEGGLPETGAGEVQVHGVLAVHGTEHPFTLLVTLDVDGQRLDVHTQFDVPFVAWGMHDPSILVLRVAKVVHVIVTSQARLTPEPVHAAR